MNHDVTASAFDPLHSVVTRSTAYREVIRACSPDLPDWLVPASVIDLRDLERVARALCLASDETFFDLGCGAGGPTIWISERSGASFVGVDKSPVAIRAAEALAKTRGLSEIGRFVVGDITATNLPDACADGIMSIDTLMFVEPTSAVAEIARLLRPGRSAVVRTVESLVEPFTSTIVQDYRPLFEASGLAVTHHDELAGHQKRSTDFFMAILARADLMFAEVGEAAAILIEEASESMKKATAAPRVRTVYIEATRR